MISLFVSLALAASCDVSMKPTGFSTVTAKKAMFDGKKSYLLEGQFVQTGETKGDLVCVLFRNYDGYGGRKTAGWLRKQDLAPIRTKLERGDVKGYWYRAKCEDDYCSVQFDGADVSFASYLHQGPAMSLNVGHVEEKPGHLLLTKITGSDAGSQSADIDYLNSKIPGTLTIEGLSGGAAEFNGVYFH